MKRIMAFAALAVMAPVTAMGATKGGWVPFEPSHAAVAGQPQALLALRCDGVTPIGNLRHVGDYWEGGAYAHGKRREIYLFDNGTLWIGHRAVTPPKQSSLTAGLRKRRARNRVRGPCGPAQSLWLSRASQTEMTAGVPRRTCARPRLMAGARSAGSRTFSP
jgi:hypothetical protein